MKVEFSWGATEVKARLLDGIVEITETGSSLRANNLKILATVMTSTTRLIANKEAWDDPFKREKIEAIALLLRGAIEGRQKVGLKMNLPSAKVSEALAILPAEKSPTVNPLADEQFVALEVILDEQVARDLVPSKLEGDELYPIRTRAIALDNWLDLYIAGELHDAMTIAALCLVERLLKGGNE